jgi:hypothetical protein
MDAWCAVAGFREKKFPSPHAPNAECVNSILLAPFYKHAQSIEL